MEKPVEQNMTFRFELFVDDLPASIDFYHRVLQFTVGEQHSDKFTPITNGNVRIGLNLRSALRVDHPIQAVEGERLGRGIEMVLEVDDVAAMYEHVLSENWPLAAELQQRPWGLTDFRVVDPSGYYLRITSRV
ncbi:putative glyoxalase superfamily protein PhnB [Pelolinea submarina]|uniref:Putative glyoxalase superfamily protein PhnB n=2 Tax=Pelolinea submarina TaxID=913107 RepID=A0A3E0AFS0_9CHLR|nr:putative glyoxalase superfamily protein PhnB [Pelolinea submarina]